MSFFDTLKTALRSLKTSKRRTLLTMLGMVIGISAVILVNALGAGAEYLITGQIARRGTDLIGVLAGASDPQGPPASALGIVVTSLTKDDALALLRKENVTHAVAAAAYQRGNDVLQYKQFEQSVTYTGTTASYEDIERVTIAQGRFFTEDDDAAHARVLVLGAEIANDIFGNEDPLGKTVKLRRKPFTVIGVLKSQGGGGLDENPDTSILLPLETAQYELLGVRHISFLRLRIDHDAYLDQSIAEIKQTLIERHGEEDFSIRTIADLLTILTTVTGAIRFFLIAIAAISLFVGGIGIMNIMLIAVKEKTREIGLRMAVGATAKDIRNQFLAETVFIAAIGGIIGMIFGILLSALIAFGVRTAGYDFPLILSISGMLSALIVSGGVGIVFGLLPAKRAAALSPVTALRYE